MQKDSTTSTAQPLADPDSSRATANMRQMDGQPSYGPLDGRTTGPNTAAAQQKWLEDLHRHLETARWFAIWAASSIGSPQGCFLKTVPVLVLELPGKRLLVMKMSLAAALRLQKSSRPHPHRDIDGPYLLYAGVERSYIPVVIPPPKQIHVVHAAGLSGRGYIFACSCTDVITARAAPSVALRTKFER
ncbi:hypothetical protein VOLCADRAFT_91616 [Volvox carteri f. nagariensis]|uniref:Uncharacterized protein n=1 Tax=Volvox carteri f. nagariensis TaxID=3068 RepID=D8TXJ5_VOLCA|nr:uncharacterized protein VOLCADRAFT_91616 [Volvox carteri f. nagariensis]EFJ47653.1 hypothetical protein VOLCADRAFT_91616 [Volvox carteri f. nagariensis]|eukprot:XP_002951124.1 hypothetical protein VOLCADRAFT_91616 [Volvox carteri f. nagariensis]